jgi:hypothetical protein
MSNPHLGEKIFKILRWSGFAILLGLVLTVSFGLAKKTYTDVNPSYDWKDENGAEKYKDVVWNKISKSRLAGFTSAGVVVMEEEIACFWSDEPCHPLISKENEYLRVEGGIISSYRFLVVIKNNETHTIKSLEELKEFFAPIDNEIEAMSFIGITERDLKENGKDVLVGETAVIDGGYLVKVVKNNTFGCGRHDPQKVIFKITKDGEITLIASEILPPEPDNVPHACVD